MVDKSENGFFLWHSQLKSGHDHFIALVVAVAFLLFLLLVSQFSITQPTRIDIENAQLDPFCTCFVEFSPCQCLNLMSSRVYEKQERKRETSRN